MAKQDSRGNTRRDHPHIRMYEWMLKSPAYRSLGVYSRVLYSELKRRYNGVNNGAIVMSFREAMEAVGCSNRPLLAAFDELQHKGFIVAVEKGAFSWKVRENGRGRATTWLLTEYKADQPTPSITASKDFMKWRPENQPKKKTRCDDGTPLVCGEHTTNTEMVCAEHTTRVTRAHHNDQNPTPDGVTRARTISIPYRGAVSAQPLSISEAFVDSINRSKAVNGGAQ